MRFLPDAAIRNHVFLGEAGCGKSEIAINLALMLRESGETVHFFDLDMTKPLFRSRDKAEELSARGLQIHFEEQFMDAPTVSGGVMRLLKDEDAVTVLDVGGDYIGARSIGGYAPLLRLAQSRLWYVVNPYRPWSGNQQRLVQVLNDILNSSHLDFGSMHLICNPNLGPDTTAEAVLEGYELLLRELEGQWTCEALVCREQYAAGIEAQLAIPLLPIRRYLAYPWEEN